VGMELQRRGLRVNLKRVRRIMREEGLCAIPSGRGWPGRPVGSGGMRTGPEYPDLVLGLAIDRPDRVWAADTTRIALEREEVFLAVVIDAFSRRCLGWSLGRTEHPAHAMRALRKALRARAGRDLRGLIHHSDRGEVYSDGAYTGLLEGLGIRISVGGRGCPGDNARVERFFGTLKRENIRLEGYSAFADALGGIRGFIDDVYNTKRLHSALGYLPPVEFERKAAAARRAGEAGGNAL